MTTLTSKTGKLPPHSPGMEQGIIGSLLQLDDPRQLQIALGRDWMIRPSELYDERNREIFYAIQKLSDKGVAASLVTLAQALMDRGQLEACGGISYLNECVDAAPSAANLEYYAHEVRQKARLRAIAECAMDLHKAAMSGADAGCVQGIVQKLNNIENASVTRSLPRKLKDVIPDVVDLLERKHQGQKTALPTGFPGLDRMLGGGLHNGEVIVLAARPSLGKTAMALNIAAHSANYLKETNDPGQVLIFSLEMAAVALGERLVQTDSGVSTFDMGILSEADFARITEALRHLTNLPVTIDDNPGRRFPDIASTALALHQEAPLRLIMIDYVQLIQGTSNGANRNQELGEISVGLHALARRLNVPILLLSQLNRDSEREDRVPKMSDIRDSGQIEQDADVCAFLWRGKEREGFAATRVNLRIAKQRNGPIGDISFLYHGPIFRFEEAPKIDAEDIPIEIRRKLRARQ